MSPNRFQFAVLILAGISAFSCSHEPAKSDSAPAKAVALTPPTLAAGQAEIVIPPGHVPVYLALGDGTQIYSCQETAPKQFGWKLDMPDAILVAPDGQKVGKHYKGPTWESNDGSKVVAAPELAVDAPDPKSAIKWVRLKATSHEKEGVFSKISFIQRVDTVGGLAPSETCDARRAGGAAVSVPYKANYYFYAPAQ